MFPNSHLINPIFVSILPVAHPFLKLQREITPISDQPGQVPSSSHPRSHPFLNCPSLSTHDPGVLLTLRPSSQEVNHPCTTQAGAGLTLQFFSILVLLFSGGHSSLHRPSLNTFTSGVPRHSSVPFLLKGNCSLCP